MISKHETSSQLKQKLIDFLADSAERIIILDIIHRRIINRYNKFLLWLGLSSLQVPEIKPNDFCRILSEFALEYRTTRERALYGIEKNKAANQKFNTITNKQQQQQSSLDSSMSPMKMRNENSNHSSLNREVRKDAELR
jgi:FH1/FH2 domain-containing protein 3